MKDGCEVPFPSHPRRFPSVCRRNGRLRPSRRSVSDTPPCPLWNNTSCPTLLNLCPVSALLASLAEPQPKWRDSKRKCWVLGVLRNPNPPNPNLHPNPNLFLPQSQHRNPHRLKLQPNLNLLNLLNPSRRPCPFDRQRRLLLSLNRPPYRFLLQPNPQTKRLPKRLLRPKPRTSNSPK